MLRDLRSLQNEMKQAAIDVLVKTYALKVVVNDKPFKSYPVIDEWRLQYDNNWRRYKFLCLWGPSRTGKTSLALSLWGEPSTFYVDCTGGKEPDLRDYDCVKHKAVIFDEIPLKVVLHHKRLMQAPHVPVPLGTSSTHMYTYRVWLAKTAIILTTNKFESEMGKLDEEDREWMISNCVQCNITESVWQ